MMQEFGIDNLVSYEKEQINDTTLLTNPEYRSLENHRKKKTSRMNVIKAKLATLTLQSESIDEKNISQKKKIYTKTNTTL